MVIPKRYAETRTGTLVLAGRAVYGLSVLTVSVRGKFHKIACAGLVMVTEVVPAPTLREARSESTMITPEMVSAHSSCM